MRSFPGIFHYTIIALRDVIQTEDLQFDLARILTSKLIFTSVLAYEMFQPLISIRKETKGYGINSLIEFKLENSQKILLT